MLFATTPSTDKAASRGVSLSLRVQHPPPRPCADTASTRARVTIHSASRLFPRAGSLELHGPAARHVPQRPLRHSTAGLNDGPTPTPPEPGPAIASPPDPEPPRAVKPLSMGRCRLEPGPKLYQLVSTPLETL